VVSYLEWLGSTQTDEQDRRARLRSAGAAIKKHEEALIERLLQGSNEVKGLDAIDDLAIIGAGARTAREGLVSFTIKDRVALDMVGQLEARGIRVHLRKNDHYSSNILQPLNIDACVRVSTCHYNTVAEIDAFLFALHDILAG
jgi:selenocysteine lyase/cysteine desulfurase